MGGICGAAVLRAVDALLRALGKDSVSLLLPATAMASDAAGQLGLVDPGVQEVIISPVIIREVKTGNPGPRRRIEFTMPASAIAGQLPSLGMGSAEDLFAAVLGANHKGNVLHVESVVPESFSGTICFYMVSCVE
jgi:hypothetical protein